MIFNIFHELSIIVSWDIILSPIGPVGHVVCPPISNVVADPHLYVLFLGKIIMCAPLILGGHDHMVDQTYLITSPKLCIINYVVSKTIEYVWNFIAFQFSPFHFAAKN